VLLGTEPEFETTPVFGTAPDPAPPHADSVTTDTEQHSAAAKRHTFEFKFSLIPRPATRRRKHMLFASRIGATHAENSNFVCM
jgi:hypothetical protein